METDTTQAEVAIAETADGAKVETPEVDWKSKSREWERRAKENAGAAKRLAEIEESQKTEAQKQAERIAALESEATSARTDALRMRIASKHGISDEDADLFLTGVDEETLTRQAARLADRNLEQKRQGNYAPNEGKTPSAGADDERTFVRELFGAGN